jgi:gamma-glutamyltranspeptidase
MTVIGKLNSPLVVALITGRRGDYIAVIDSNGNAVGVAATLIFGPGLSVADGAAFVPQINTG